MGDGLTENQPKEPLTYSRIFREAFPSYLVMGMTPQEYWEGEAFLTRSYREAYRMRMDREERMNDRNAWRIGEYIRNAIASVGVTVNGFAPKGHSLHKYPEKPFLESAEEQKITENRKKQEENKQMMAQAMFQVFAEKMNKNIRKRLDKEQATATQA